MKQKSSFNWNPFLTWLAANILGFGSLGIALHLIPSILSPSGILSSVLIISIPVSLAQWLALRRFFPISILWIFTIPIGLSVVILMGKYLPNSIWDYVDDEALTTWIVSYLIMGVVISLPQWIILRRYCDKASLWILGTSLGAALGMGAVIATDLVNQSGIISYILAFILYAIPTGLTLAWLLENSNQSEIPAVSVPESSNYTE
jgi:hypothetical protein